MSYLSYTNTGAPFEQASNFLGAKMGEGLNPDVVLKNDTILNINKSITNLENFAILSPISDNLNYPNYRINKYNECMIIRSVR